MISRAPLMGRLRHAATVPVRELIYHFVPFLPPAANRKYIANEIDGDGGR
jgi:hypothetical protein